MKLFLAFALSLLACSANADPVVDRVVDTVALPRLAAFSESAAALDTAAATDCRADALKAPWNAAMDAWLPVQAFRAGPLEDEGRGLAIAFWPDPKGATPRALGTLLKDGLPDRYASVSVAARGLYALELMLYDPDFSGYGETDPGCALVRAAAADLAETAAAAAAQWGDTFAPALKSAGDPGNSRFLTAAEARQFLFTQLLTQLDFDEETRLGRPLGSLDKPRPARAENRLSGRSLQNLRISLAANEALARAMSDGGTETLFPAFDYAASVAAKLTDPVFAEVETVSGRFRVQELANAIHRARETAMAELGAELGVSAGFNALDGD